MRNKFGEKTSPTRKAVHFLALAIPLVCGSFLIFVTMLICYGQIAFITKSKIAQGTVVKVEYSESIYKGRVVITDWPTIEFTVSGERTITFKPNETFSDIHYFMGQKVDVLYLPEKPSEAKIDSIMSLFGPSMLIGVIGATLIGFPLYLARKTLRHRKYAN